MKYKSENNSFDNNYISYIMITNHSSITIVVSNYLSFCLIFLYFDW